MNPKDDFLPCPGCANVWTIVSNSFSARLLGFCCFRGIFQKMDFWGPKSTTVYLKKCALCWSKQLVKTTEVPTPQLLIIHGFQGGELSERDKRKPLGKQRRELEPLGALWSVGRKWSCQLLYSCFTNLTHEQVSKSKQRLPQAPP